MASLKVGMAFGYHAAVLILSLRDFESSCANSVTMENRPSKAGVERRIALSDHWRCVSTGNLNHPVGSTVPETDATALPADFGIFENSGELLQGLAFDGGPAAAFALWRREGK